MTGARPLVPGLGAALAPRRPGAVVDHERPALEVRSFDFFFGPVQILYGLRLPIAPRSVTAVIGPSGCGKSTLLRSINRLNDLTPGARYGGDILLEGKSVFAPGTDVVRLRRRIGMVFQRPNPFPKSVYDNVAYGAALNRLAAPHDLPDLVERLLRRAALWDEVKDRLDRPATELSGGQQQRLCIARALANQPEVLLMDEPCSALDPLATQKIEELIFELQQDYTIVIVTHNMQQAARVSAMTAFLDQGALIEYGPTEQIFTRPAEERTEAYITGRFG